MESDKRLHKLFLKTSSEISAADVMQLFKPLYSTVGSPRRGLEELVMANLMTFVQAAEGKF